MQIAYYSCNFNLIFVYLSTCYRTLANAIAATAADAAAKAKIQTKTWRKLNEQKNDFLFFVTLKTQHAHENFVCKHTQTLRI